MCCFASLSLCLHQVNEKWRYLSLQVRVSSGCENKSISAKISVAAVHTFITGPLFILSRAFFFVFDLKKKKHTHGVKIFFI